MCKISSKTQLVELWYVNYTNTYYVLLLLLFYLLVLLFHSYYCYDIIFVTILSNTYIFVIVRLLSGGEYCCVCHVFSRMRRTGTHGSLSL